MIAVPCCFVKRCSISRANSTSSIGDFCRCWSQRRPRRSASEFWTCLCEQFVEAERSPAAPSAVQLGQVEQYIVANYAKPLTVETLAEISGVSAQSVLSHFRSRY